MRQFLASNSFLNCVSFNSCVWVSLNILILCWKQPARGVHQTVVLIWANNTVNN
jgi:hypothetical protein